MFPEISHQLGKKQMAFKKKKKISFKFWLVSLSMYNRIKNYIL